MTRVLLTGFDAFGSNVNNPTQALIDTLRESAPSHWRLAVLPTSFRRARTQLLDLLSTEQPDEIVHFGLSASSLNLRLERLARNANTSLATDNDGTSGAAIPVIAGAPLTYSARCDYERLLELAAATGESAALSDDAGGFVCNHVFYCTAHWVTTHRPHARFGFVHVPAMYADDERRERLARLVHAWLST